MHKQFNCPPLLTFARAADVVNDIQMAMMLVVDANVVREILDYFCVDSYTYTIAVGGLEPILSAPRRALV